MSRISTPFLILYFLCFLLASSSTGSALYSSLKQTALWYFYLLLLLYFFLFVIVTVYRPFLLDLTTNLEYRERFGIFLIHLAFFTLPQLYFRPSNFILGLSFLNLPLIAFLLRQHNFYNFYLNNVLIFFFGLFYSPQPTFLSFILFSSILLITFMADYVAFKFDKYSKITEKIDLKIFVQPILIVILSVFVCAGSLFLFTPQMKPRELKIFDLLTVEERRPLTVKPLNEATIFELALNIFLLILSVFVLLAIMNWLNKKLRGRRPPGAVLKPASTIAHFKKILRQALSRTFRISLEDPRSAIIYYYNLFCEEMEHLGHKRHPHITPRDYEIILTQKFHSLSNLLSYLRETFELAKYSPAPVTKTEAQNYLRQTEELLKEVKALLSKSQTLAN